MKTRNPIANAAKEIRHKVVPDKREILEISRLLKEENDAMENIPWKE